MNTMSKEFTGWAWLNKNDPTIIKIGEKISMPDMHDWGKLRAYATPLEALRGTQGPIVAHVRLSGNVWEYAPLAAIADERTILWTVDGRQALAKLPLQCARILAKDDAARDFVRESLHEIGTGAKSSVVAPDGLLPRIKHMRFLSNTILEATGRHFVEEALGLFGDIQHEWGLEIDCVNRQLEDELFSVYERSQR